MTIVYFIVAGDKSSRAFDDYFECLECLAYISETDPELDARLVAVDSRMAGEYHDQELLKPSK